MIEKYPAPESKYVSFVILIYKPSTSWNVCSPFFKNLIAYFYEKGSYSVISIEITTIESMCCMYVVQCVQKAELYGSIDNYRVRVYMWENKAPYDNLVDIVNNL